MLRTEMPKTIYLKDYKAPIWKIIHTDMSLQIFEDKTIVNSKLSLQKLDGDADELILNGEHLILKSIKLNGKALESGKNYAHNDKSLTLINPPNGDFSLEIETEIDPANNTRLEGLYKSGGNWCTQCEAEGFRTITYYQDRPDVMATFRVRLEANKKTCPVLLSNGNLIEHGDLKGGRHFTVWDDPFPKPCYLFAIVAGDLVHIEDTFKTAENVDVTLRIYVRAGDEGQCAHAMESLIKSMKWDEDVYGRVYNYDIFNIVAVSDFNMGAMENTSLNIFNTALVLAQPETATDMDYERVEGVIAHEYFHNWTGNRVTCRDWFQLSLKEGLTVFRDQEFSADLNSRGVKRIDDVALLRRLQFPEDSGPMAHPIRPDNYIEINNFYTVTVYEKGAEVIRMLHTLLGADTYRKATDLYFERFDGQAVKCEDFVKCMEDASGRDLSQFFRWYEQAGTPVILSEGTYNQKDKTYTLRLTQSCPPTPKQKLPYHIPVRTALLDPSGKVIAEKLLELTKTSQEFVFENIGQKPVPSILRGLSAPVKLRSHLSDDDHRFLMVHDNDGFNRWESGQKLALKVISALLTGKKPSQDYTKSYAELLKRAVHDEDKALMARAIRIPDFNAIAQEQKIVDPEAIQAARQALVKQLVSENRDIFETLYHENKIKGDYSPDPQSMGRRALCNIALQFLTHARSDDDAKMAMTHFENANNMTDRMAALACLVETTSPLGMQAITGFYDEFKAYPLVIDKWFAVQAMAVRDDIMGHIHALKAHSDFTMKNPNRVRSLYGAFCMSNPICFHREDGAGYHLLADAVVELNEINPQIAARLLTPLREWRRYTPDRQEKMKETLNRILNIENLSPDVYEIVSKTLS
jgi:aminopeptidase N